MALMMSRKKSSSADFLPANSFAHGTYDYAVGTYTDGVDTSYVSYLSNLGGTLIFNTVGKSAMTFSANVSGGAHATAFKNGVATVLTSPVSNLDADYVVVSCYGTANQFNVMIS